MVLWCSAVNYLVQLRILCPDDVYLTTEIRIYWRCGCSLCAHDAIVAVFFFEIVCWTETDYIMYSPLQHNT